MKRKQFYAQEIADDLVAHLDDWYSLPETWDDELDRQISEWYANAPSVFPKRPYFSPSASNADPRELYYKALRAKKDQRRKQPHTGRWTAIGTAVGDIIQRDVLAMERNLEKKAGHSPRFRFERNEDGTPVFEDFAKKNVQIEHGGKKFYLFGTCDGIMEYYTEDGEKLRVGLEVKTKQATPARTSKTSMKEPDRKHVNQCVCYAEMYDVDYYVILYVNTAHKGWVMSEEDYEKTPDIRAFGLYITQPMKDAAFDYFVGVLQSVEDRKPKPLDLEKWTFNSYKEAIVADMRPEEYEKIQKYAERVKHAKMAPWLRNTIVRAADDIKQIRDSLQADW